MGVALAVGDTVFNNLTGRDNTMSGERRAIRQAIADAFGLDFKSENPMLDKAADSVLAVFDRTRPLPGTWGLLGGGQMFRTQADVMVEKIKAVAETLERELRFNDIGSHRDFDTLAKRIINAETHGQTLAQWIAWAKRDERSRAYLFTYARNPLLIWQDWPQAFPESSVKLENDGGMYV